MELLSALSAIPRNADQQSAIRNQQFRYRSFIAHTEIAGCYPFPMTPHKSFFMLPFDLRCRFALVLPRSPLYARGTLDKTLFVSTLNVRNRYKNQESFRPGGSAQAEPRIARMSPIWNELTRVILAFLSVSSVKSVVNFFGLRAQPALGIIQ